MIPILYKANETNFSTQGLGALRDAITCNVIEERNGNFIFEMKYPIDGVNYHHLQVERIVVMDASQRLKDQRFVITRITQPATGIILVEGEHISQYVTRNAQLNPKVTFKGNAQSALETWKANLIGLSVPLTVSSNVIKNSSGEWLIEEVENAREALGGVEGSILDSYHGEYLFDNLNIKLLTARGQDNNVLIAYGKNLTEFEQENELASTVTSIQPWAKVSTKNGDVIVTLKEKVLHANNVDQYVHKKIQRVDLSGDDVKTEAELRTKAYAYMDKNDVGVPKIRIRLSFVDLNQTLDYLDKATTETIGLCDFVYVDFERFGVSRAKYKVVKVNWNVILEHYNTIEVGTMARSFSQNIPSNKIVKSLTQTIIARETESILEQGRVIATDLINAGFGGYVRYYPDRILIMDTNDEATAVNVWQFNLNGQGYSQTGINGPYTQAWTKDGKLNTDFIGVGSILASHIKAGELTAEMVNIESNVTVGAAFAGLAGKLDSLKVGARNMLLGSWEPVKNSNYLIKEYPLSKPLEVGKEYTATIWGSLGAGKTCFGAWYNSGLQQLGKLNDLGNGRYQVTFKNTYTSEETNTIRFYTVDSATVVESRIDYAQLEEGNLGTDWGLAPEDMETKLTELEQKALDATSEAKTSAEDLARAQAEAERIKAEAYADGILSKEEQARIAAVQSALDDAKQAAADAQQAALEASKKYTDETTGEIKAWFRIDGATATLGREDSPFSFVITNERTYFLINGKVASSWTHNLMEVPAIKTDSIELGAFQFKLEANGSLSII